MNSKAFFLLAAFTYIYCTTTAQTDKISGKVLNAETNSPLAGASVILEVTASEVSDQKGAGAAPKGASSDQKGASTDVEGRFFLPVKRGLTYQLKISSVGFTSKTFPDIIPGNTPLYLEVVLQLAGSNLQQVVVTTNIRKESIASLYKALRSFQQRQPRAETVGRITGPDDRC